MSKLFKKIISTVTVVTILITMSLGNVSRANAEVDLDILGTYQGRWKHIATCKRAFYFDKGSSFEVRFRYDAVDKNTGINYNNTLEYQVFDNKWNGWQRVFVGPNGYDKTQSISTPKVGDTYTIQVPISVIESKYTGTESIHGINLRLGEIGDSKITILSHKIVGDVVREGAEFIATGSWQKGNNGTMTLINSSKENAVISTNVWNIDVSQFSVNGFTNPTVDVTVNYSGISGDYVQAEIKVDDKPVNENYVIPRKKGTMTYTTELPQGTTSFLACYDQCTVTMIRVYDNTQAEPAEVTGKNAEDINASLNPSWNLGNALDSVDMETGEAGETFWGNPVVTQKLFQKVKAAGFRSVRIPVSYMDKVDDSGNIEENYLARIKKVVSVAKNSGLYVIINVQHDGGEGVAGKWIDISKTGDEFAKIKKKFTKMWKQIAYTFQDYDQHLVFESMNNVMVSGSPDSTTASAYININALNQAFVNAIRSAGGYSPERCLIIPGYNADIDLTVADYGTEDGFQVPIDTEPNKLILSVHFFEPYDFTSNIDSDKTTCTTAELRQIGTQFMKITSVTSLPVFVGSYGAVDKDNVYDRADYLDRVRREADKRGITLAYWDNGNYGNMGTKSEAFAIFDRQSNQLTEEGEILVSAIMGTYDQ